MCLHDLTDGTLLALLDSATVTAWRTGLAAALATHVLATDQSAVVGVVGAGTQAAMVLAGLTALRKVERLVVHDVVPERSAEFLTTQGIPGTTATSAQEVAAKADVVVLATWSRAPLLTAADLRPGLHLTTLGADEPGKIELSADLLRNAGVIVDDWALAVQMGALGNVGVEAKHATLSEVLTGTAAGRRTPDEVTVYAPVGLPWQDLAVAWPAYLAAKETAPTIDFLS
ncbi:NAD(P)-binding domain-containing protein [Kribbella sp. NPDC048915]|uniref:ornithine cyclodeaminase family protein n=1 Tax=Kribbella sp. NPDC048915 TaxID=3155148 RepID=UPI0033EEEA08